MKVSDQDEYTENKGQPSAGMKPLWLGVGNSTNDILQ